MIPTLPPDPAVRRDELYSNPKFPLRYVEEGSVRRVSEVPAITIINGETHPEARFVGSEAQAPRSAPILLKLEKVFAPFGPILAEPFAKGGRGHYPPLRFRVEFLRNPTILGQDPIELFAL